MKKMWRKIMGKEGSVDQQIRWRTVISFLVFFLFIIAGYMGWKALYNEPKDNEMLKTLRKGSDINAKISGAVYDTIHAAKTYPKSEAVKKVRVNGDIGMGKDFDAAAWQMKVVRKAGDTLFLTLDDIKALPKTNIVFDFKCIEGWSQVTHWGGAKFSDFIKKYDLDSQASMLYAGLITPDQKYYVGIDMPSMINPQTLLCYEMNDKPLPMDQGYPLRLIIPVKYGIKHLKRIGTIYFQNAKPADYWAEQGYDYYSGL
jgi:DMSO/TMAO reductase YedYZ molybdopterin-dependent catalytic subunit